MKKIALSLLLMMTVAVFAQQKPKIRILATGGTIAGVSKSNTETNYKAGELGIYCRYASRDSYFWDCLDGRYLFQWQY